MKKIVSFAALLILSTSAYSNSITVDVGNKVEDIYEIEKITGACDSYWSLLNEDDTPKKGVDPKGLKEKEILCGKALFLGWETSGSLPLPELLYDAMRRTWPDRTGDHYEKFGFIKNPYSKKGWPLGVAKSTKKYMGLPSVNIGCAACHVGELPDGRIAIGAPNSKLNMSEFNLMSYYTVYIAASKKERAAYPKQVVEYFEKRKKTEKRHLRNEKGGIAWSNVIFKYSRMLGMLGLGTKAIPDAKFVKMPPDSDLLSWVNGRPGVFNPGSPMLTVQVKDVPNVSIPQVWGVTGFHKDYEAGLTNPVGQINKYSSLENFVKSAFVYTFQDTSLVRDRNVRPFVSYLRQITTPKIMETLSPNLVKKGKDLFDRNCQSCHDGVAGETTKLILADELSVDKSLEHVMADYQATTPIAELVKSMADEISVELNPQPVGIKSRRLSGIWARTHLMTDGSIDNLEDLFCLKGVRVREKSPHPDLCTSYSLEEKKSLIEFLKTF